VFAGTDLAYLRRLVGYWAEELDWPGQEAATVARAPRFRTRVGDVRVRSHPVVVSFFVVSQSMRRVRWGLIEGGPRSRARIAETLACSRPGRGWGRRAFIVDRT
jgi:hypothetical protein